LQITVDGKRLAACFAPIPFGRVGEDGGRSRIYRGIETRIEAGAWSRGVAPAVETGANVSDAA